MTTTSVQPERREDVRSRKARKKINEKRITPRDPLAMLTVIDRLEVGPVQLEPTRLSVPYRVYQKGKSEQAELRYRFGESVFDSRDADCQNLATMIGAQVALNYGLFCKEIVLHGPLDGHDQRFLTEMARNTAREIYVKKFLEPNPFLRGAAGQLPVIRQEVPRQDRLALLAHRFTPIILTARFNACTASTLSRTNMPCPGLLEWHD